MTVLPQFREFEITDFNGCEDAAIRMCEEIIRLCEEALAFDPLRDARKPVVLRLPAPGGPDDAPHYFFGGRGDPEPVILHRRPKGL